MKTLKLDPDTIKQANQGSNGVNAPTKTRKEGSIFHSKKISQGSNLIEKERKSKTANNAIDRHNPYNPKREKNNVILDIRTGIKKSKE